MVLDSSAVFPSSFSFTSNTGWFTKYSFIALRGYLFLVYCRLIFQNTKSTAWWYLYARCCEKDANKFQNTTYRCFSWFTSLSYRYFFLSAAWPLLVAYLNRNSPFLQQLLPISTQLSFSETASAYLTRNSFSATASANLTRNSLFLQQVPPILPDLEILSLASVLSYRLRNFSVEVLQFSVLE